GSGGVDQQYLVRDGVEPDPVRPGYVPCAGARYRHARRLLQPEPAGQDPLQCQGRARRRVALARVVGLLDERIVAGAAEQLRGARDDPIEEVHADGEIRTVDQRGAARLYDLPRSEEHTSELQSHLKLVCRLLLEKKKTHK